MTLAQPILFNCFIAISFYSFSEQTTDFSQSASGSYRSEPSPDGYWLELRVDIDAVQPFTEVLDIVSGDIFNGNHFIASFMCEDVELEEQNETLVLLGEATFPLIQNASMKLEVGICRDGGKVSANVVLMQEGRNFPHLPHKMEFLCLHYSKFFRTIHLEIDYDNEDYLNLPKFKTTWHKGLMEKYGERRLSLFTLYRDAGIDLIWDKELSNLVQDPDPSDPWKWEEMMSIMEDELGDVHSKRKRASIEDGRKDWKIWLLLGKQYAASNKHMLGVMFDTGMGETSRNGTSVFVDSHKNLPSWDHFDRPQNSKEAVALWNYLFTLVHEVGHTLNLSHTFFPSQYFGARPEALSFMNYPEQYRDGAKGGFRAFFEEFMFTFTREELVFIRHMSYDIVRPGMTVDRHQHPHPVRSDSRPEERILLRLPSVSEHLDLRSG